MVCFRCWHPIRSCFHRFQSPSPICEGTISTWLQAHASYIVTNADRSPLYNGGACILSAQMIIMWMKFVFFFISMSHNLCTFSNLLVNRYSLLLLLFEILSSPTFRCFSWVLVISSSLETRLSTWFVPSRAATWALLIMSVISKASWVTDTFLEEVPTYQRDNFSHCFVHLFHLSCQVSITLYLRLHLHGILIPRYRKVYQDPFLSAFIHKCDIRAIAFQALVNQDGRILHLLILGYLLW